MTSDITKVNGYNDLYSFSVEMNLGKNRQYSNSKRRENIKAYDKNGNHAIEYWELMQAVNTQRRKEIFSKNEIESDKRAYEIGAPILRKINRMLQGAPLAKDDTGFHFTLQASLAAGFRENKTSELLATITFYEKNNISEFASDYFDTLPEDIRILTSKNYSHDQIYGTLIALAAMGKEGTGGAYLAQAELISAGFSLNQINSLFEVITAHTAGYINIDAGHRDATAFYVSPRGDAFKQAAKAAVFLKKYVGYLRTIEILKSIAVSAGDASSEAFRLIPKLVGHGLSVDQSAYLLKQIASKLKHWRLMHVYRELPNIIKSLKNSKSEIKEIINGVIYFVEIIRNQSGEGFYDAIDDFNKLTKDQSLNIDQILAKIKEKYQN